MINPKDERFSHLDAAEVEKVKNLVLEKQAWFEKHVNLCNHQKAYDNPTVLTGQIMSQVEVRMVTQI